MRDWIDNEPGPVCHCGSATVVKVNYEGAVVLCLFHSAEAGMYGQLESIAPDDFTETVAIYNASFDRLKESVKNKEISAEQAAEAFKPVASVFQIYMKDVWKAKDDASTAKHP